MARNRSTDTVALEMSPFLLWTLFAVMTITAVITIISMFMFITEQLQLSLLLVL